MTDVRKRAASYIIRFWIIAFVVGWSAALVYSAHWWGVLALIAIFSLAWAAVECSHSPKEIP